MYLVKDIVLLKCFSIDIQITAAQYEDLHSRAWWNKPLEMFSHILQFKGALTTLVISLSIQSNVCNNCFCDKMTEWNNKSNS